jgi:hypothetical protein
MRRGDEQISASISHENNTGALSAPDIQIMPINMPQGTLVKETLINSLVVIPAHTLQGMRRDDELISASLSALFKEFRRHDPPSATVRRAPA